MILLLLFFFFFVAIWGVVSFFALKALYNFGFVGDATLKTRRIYLVVSAIIIIFGFLGIILV